MKTTRTNRFLIRIATTKSVSSCVRRESGQRLRRQNQRSATSTPDLHEFHPVSGSRINLQNISNARGVELVFEQVGFQGRGLLRFQAVVERASRHGDMLGETECFREILSIGQREF